MYMVSLLAKYRVEINHNVCQGFGACVELCSKFELGDEDGKSHVEGAQKTSKGEAVELDELECHKQAAEACPYNAIHITNLETDEKLV
jgi:ferredoxin